MKMRYTVVLQPEVAGGFSVSVPSLHGAVTQGDTFEQAMENARDVIECFLAIYAEDGEEIPIEFAPGFAVSIEVDAPTVQPAETETATAA